MCPEAVLLLPPSDGKRVGGLAGTRYGDVRRDPAANKFATLEASREALWAHLVKFQSKAKTEVLEAAFEAKGANLAHAVEANARLYDAPVMAAIDRYTGVLFENIAYAQMPAKAQEGFRERAIIVSGLFGLVGPGDLIPDYKLRMDATLPGAGLVSAWWKPRLSPALDAATKGRFVWNLLGEQHAAAWTGAREAAGDIRVRFVERRNGKERSMSHSNKALKGAFARHLATRGWGLASAEKFENDGYRYSAELSSVKDARGEMVFAKGA